MPFALLSVSDKTNLVPFASFLLEQGYSLVSTGGTYRQLEAELPPKTDLRSVSDLTKFPEILDGRVKTLHPTIHGGLLGARHLPSHQAQMAEHEIPPIDILVVNLYPFHQAVQKELPLPETTELIDIGGVALIRAGAKNFRHVLVITSPTDYERIATNFDQIRQSPRERQLLAIQAFQHTAQYDVQISNYLGKLLPEEDTTETQKNPEYQLRLYQSILPLKYGCNPHQKEANLWQLVENSTQSPVTQSAPITLLQGQPGYINLLDALNGWQLVSEAKQLFHFPCAASFKHTSPAGVGLGVPLSETLAWVYEAPAEADLTPQATAYLRARNADPMSSFGDFVALSHECDLATAKLIKREVSDGIIAPSYQPDALALLKKKKGGKYLILKANENYQPQNQQEFREMFGLALSQPPNRARVDFGVFQAGGKAGGKAGDEEETNQIPAEAQQDLLLANLTLKYAQSNNVALAKDGQIIGLAAGQQSRIDCVKLVCRKASLWYLRQHPLVKHLTTLFKPETKRQERVNAIVRYLEGDFTTEEYSVWQQSFSETPRPITLEEKHHFLQTLSNVSMASDAFFPFRDNIDHASKTGVKYVMQPGGSTRDMDVEQAVADYGMQMVMTGVRMFTH